MASAPMWKLRRLAPRAQRVLERRKQEASVLMAYEATLVPTADAFITAYDRAARAPSVRRKEIAEGHSAAQELVVAVRGWMPLLARDVPGFDGVSLTASSVPDDAIEATVRVLGIIADQGSAAGNPLPYEGVIRGELEAKLSAARKEVAESEAADSAHQQLLAEARTAAESFDTELKAFRRTLAAVIGRRDRDFQKLRSQRAAQRDEDDDANAPLPPDADAPVLEVIRASA